MLTQEVFRGYAGVLYQLAERNQCSILINIIGCVSTGPLHRKFNQAIPAIILACPHFTRIDTVTKRTMHHLIPLHHRQ